MLSVECWIIPMTKDTFPMNIGGGKVRSERMLLAKEEKNDVPEYEEK